MELDTYADIVSDMLVHNSYAFRWRAHGWCAGLLFRENAKKDERLWEHIADPSAKYDFKVRSTRRAQISIARLKLKCNPLNTGPHQL